MGTAVPVLVFENGNQITQVLLQHVHVDLLVHVQTTRSSTTL